MRTQRLQVKRRKFGYVVYPLHIVAVVEIPSKFSEERLLGPLWITAVPEGKREVEKVIRKVLIERMEND